VKNNKIQFLLTFFVTIFSFNTFGIDYFWVNYVWLNDKSGPKKYRAIDLTHQSVEDRKKYYGRHLTILSNKAKIFDDQLSDKILIEDSGVEVDVGSDMDELVLQYYLPSDSLFQKSLGGIIAFTGKNKVVEFRKLTFRPASVKEQKSYIASLSAQNEFDQDHNIDKKSIKYVVENINDLMISNEKKHIGFFRNSKFFLNEKLVYSNGYGFVAPNDEEKDFLLYFLNVNSKKYILYKGYPYKYFKQTQGYVRWGEFGYYLIELGENKVEKVHWPLNSKRYVEN
jgi:hypothetical protein